MPEPTALLLTGDLALVKVVEGVIQSIPTLGRKTAGPAAPAGPRLGRPDVALVLVHLPAGGDVAEAARLLKAVAAARRPVAAVVLSDRYQAEQALALMRAGAADCLERPLDLARLAYLADVLTVRQRYAAPRQEPAPVRRIDGPQPFLFESGAAMGELMEQVHRVAPQETTVLLTGETGTGKTRLARLIHDLSPRRREPFLVVHGGALSASLIESELFGHVRGAFTGADRDRAGKFAEAGRGTLLLDEVDALPPALQAKLLRAVEDRLFEPVGTNRSLPVQARLIAATNRALEEEVAAGRFRSDLYYRLNVVAFCLPPLRERPDIIPALADQFLAEFAARNGRAVRAISAAAGRALRAFPWPGNVRELRNVMERAVALCPGPEIELADFPAALRPAAPTPRPAGGQPAVGSLAQTKEEAEATRISVALRRHGNNRRRAAAELGISRKTLYKKLHLYGLIGA